MDRGASRFFLVSLGALLLAGATSCGHPVDLGGPSPDPPATDLDGGPPTTLYQFHDGLDGCAGVSVDDEYVYMSTRDADGSSVHRCRKANCAATITRITGPFCDLCVYPRISAAANRLGMLIGENRGSTRLSHIESCTLPDCPDRQLVVPNFPASDDFAFDGEHVFWGVVTDLSLYQCGLPTCAEGPSTFAAVTASYRRMEPTSDWIYWVDGRGRVTRKRKDAINAAEGLELGPVLGLSDGDAGTSSVPPGLGTSEMAADDSWLYAVMTGSPDAGTPTCNDSNGNCLILRWPAELGGVRELVYASSGPLDTQGNSLRVFQGELVFKGQDGLARSCDADACMATVRPLGPTDPELMASDANYLYMCTRSSDPRFGQLQRIARLRR